MLKSFTRNYYDNSTEAGFQFTFYCDICNDGFKSSFIESETYKKKSGLRGLAQGASILGGLLGGTARSIGYGLERGTNVLSERFEERSPEWQKEHERAFEKAQNEAMQHFHRCHGCQKWVCSADFNEEQGLCIECAPRQDIEIAKARSEAMKKNIESKIETTIVWDGELETKTTICSSCNKPAGSGKFCNNCGASMELRTCPSCGNKASLNTKFCNNCGTNLNAVLAKNKCSQCGIENEPNTKFCGNCGNKLI